MRIKWKNTCSSPCYYCSGPINISSLVFLSLHWEPGTCLYFFFFLMSWYTMEILSRTGALFCIHHGGDKETGGVSNGERTGKVFPVAFHFSSVGNWALLQGMKVLG